MTDQYNEARRAGKAKFQNFIVSEHFLIQRALFTERKVLGG